MRRHLSSLGVSLVLAFTLAAAQAPADMERHVAAAKAAAGNDHGGLFDRTCTQARDFAAARAAAPASGARAGGARAGGAGRGAGPPARDTWHAEPAKVFDNLYYVGEIEYSAWAVTTSAGIILIDAIFDYSVEDEVVGGLKKLGLDPAQIKYVVVSHAHGDHAAGAKFLQERGIFTGEGGVIGLSAAYAGWTVNYKSLTKLVAATKHEAGGPKPHKLPDNQHM